jgi:hypothetical protein
MGCRSAGCETNLAVGRPAFFVPLTIFSVVSVQIVAPTIFVVGGVFAKSRTSIDPRAW